MDPGTSGQAIGWGRSAWNFLHGMTLDPTANHDAKRAQKKLLLLLRQVLPCPNCRASYRRFSRDLERGVPPEQVGDFVVHVHDCVNLKLNKQAAGVSDAAWKAFQLDQFQRLGYASYVEDMFFFLFTLAANYPVKYTDGTVVCGAYRQFFTTLPRAMHTRPWSNSLQEALPRLERALCEGRDALLDWVYKVYAATVRQPRPKSQVVETMEAMRKPMVDS